MRTETSFRDRASSARVHGRLKALALNSGVAVEPDNRAIFVAGDFQGEKDPRREDLSKTKRAAILDEMMTVCQQYIGSEFLATLRKRCEEILLEKEFREVDQMEIN